MATRYGYIQHESGLITVNQEQAATINLIFDFYLEGNSLGGIADVLKQERPLGTIRRMYRAVF